jgi:ribosomal protein S18 acetylase RimI-like enzyme
VILGGHCEGVPPGAISGYSAERREGGTDVMGVMIRACSEEDLDTLREIALETFRETFATMSAAEAMNRYVGRAFARRKLLAELRTRGSTFFFLQADGALAGYLKTNVCAAQSDAVDPDALEIERIYVRKPYQGNGFGRRLMEFALEQAARQGRASVWLGVWEKNVKAIAFYERLGFSKCGVHEFRMGEELQSDYIMKKKVIAGGGGEESGG